MMGYAMRKENERLRAAISQAITKLEGDPRNQEPRAVAHYLRKVLEAKR